jgi:poly[(R)-3-hydroxyalkanoate] polymerase subunit PhaC
MGTTFSLLRSRDLLWRYVTAGWLMGEDPPAFDMLAWNADSTRMPATMYSQYLRSCYIDNALSRGAMELGGTPLRLKKITAPLYVLSAREDHIAPWRTCYKTTHLVGGDVRYVLSSSGHIAGVVNPPSPKRSYWVGESQPKRADAWLKGADERPGSWWEDWSAWVEGHAGERRQPPPLGTEKRPALVDAPGSYVHEK